MLANQNYFYIIPAPLAESGKPQKALLYGLITSLSNKTGVCYASNEYLSQKLNRRDRSITRAYLTELEKEGWISIKDRNSNKRKIIIDPRKNPQVENRKSILNVRKNPQVDMRKKPHERAEKSSGQRAEKTAQSSISFSNRNKVSTDFDIFWNLYDKKVGKNKTEKKWNLLSQEDRQVIIDCIPKYKKSKTVEIDGEQILQKQYMKNSETFLNNKSWEDEIIETSEMTKERLEEKTEQKQEAEKRKFTEMSQPRTKDEIKRNTKALERIRKERFG